LENTLKNNEKGFVSLGLAARHPGDCEQMRFRMAATETGTAMTLKKKLTRTEFRKRADDILMRLSLDVEPFWQDSGRETATAAAAGGG
jgi:hypothetical protein